MILRPTTYLLNYQIVCCEALRSAILATACLLVLHVMMNEMVRANFWCTVEFLRKFSQCDLIGKRNTSLPFSPSGLRPNPIGRAACDAPVHRTLFGLVGDPYSQILTPHLCLRYLVYLTQLNHLQKPQRTGIRLHKKVSRKLLYVSSPNIDRFSKFFIGTIGYASDSLAACVLVG